MLIELKQLLNDKVIEFVSKKVTVDGGFHRCISDCIAGVLEDNNIDGVLEYRPWYIKLNLEYCDGIVCDMDKVFKLNIDLKRDARYKFDVYGTVNNLEFTLCDDTMSDFTLSQLITHNTIKSKKYLIARNEQEIAKRLAEIEEYNNNITRLKTELETIEKQTL